MLINNKIVAVKITITIKIIFYNNNLLVNQDKDIKTISKAPLFKQ